MLVVELGHLRNMLGPRVDVRVGRIEAIDVRKQDQTVGADHLGDPGREAIIVAVADFLGCDGVVLVYDGHGAALQQGEQRVRSVQISSPTLAVS